MTEAHTRFRPPPLALDDASRWVLARAFGPPGAAPSPPERPAKVPRRASRFALHSPISACSLPPPQWARGEQRAQLRSILLFVARMPRR